MRQRKCGHGGSQCLKAQWTWKGNDDAGHGHGRFSPPCADHGELSHSCERPVPAYRGVAGVGAAAPTEETMAPITSGIRHRQGRRAIVPAGVVPQQDSNCQIWYDAAKSHRHGRTAPGAEKLYPPRGIKQATSDVPTTGTRRWANRCGSFCNVGYDSMHDNQRTAPGMLVGAPVGIVARPRDKL